MFARKKDVMDHTALAVNDLTIKYGDVCHVVRYNCDK